MKFDIPIVMILFALFMSIIHFSSCVSINKPDFTARIEYDGNLKTEGSLELGEKFKMYIDAISDNPLTYQWYKDNDSIKGAVADSLVIDSLTVEHVGVYKCIVSTRLKSIFSKPYKLRVKENNQEAKNKPPEFQDSLPNSLYKVKEGENLTILFDAIYENNGKITYTLIENTLPRPEMTVFDTAYKKLTWTSKQGDKGTYRVVIEASDGKLTTEKEVLIGIGRVNLPPRISISNVNPGDTVYITENENYRFTAKISDIDTRDRPTFNEPENLPEGATFDNNSGIFSFMPDYKVSTESSNKFFHAITIHATDNAVENPLQTKFVFHIIVQDLKFFITAGVDSGGTIDPSGKISVEPGQNCSLKIIPNAYWKIKKVLVNGNDKGVVSSHTFIDIQQDNTIKAVFEKISYSLDILSDDNGSANPEEKIKVSSDIPIMVTVNPNNGYEFEKWEILRGNPEIKSISVDTFVVLVKGEPAAIKALFIEKDQTIVTPPCQVSLPEPVLQFMGKEEYTVKGKKFTRYKLPVKNWHDYPNSLFTASPDLPPCGLNTSASRTWVRIYDSTGKYRYGFCAFNSNDDLLKIWFAVPVGSIPPEAVKIILKDRLCEKEYVSNYVFLTEENDKDGPKITLKEPLEDNTTVVTSSVAVTIICTDKSGVKSVACTLNGEPLSVTDNMDSSYSVTVEGLKNGENSVTFTATDFSSNANKTKKSITILYDSSLSDKDSLEIDSLSAPKQLSPANGTIYNIYPRKTELKWASLSGAKSYTVEVDCYHCCGRGKWCTDVGRTYRIVTNLTSTTYTFNYVGAQPGRWRVWAVDSKGKSGGKSAWWKFTHKR